METIGISKHKYDSSNFEVMRFKKIREQAHLSANDIAKAPPLVIDVLQSSHCGKLCVSYPKYIEESRCM